MKKILSFMILIPLVFAQLQGDTNNDNVVDLKDLILVARNFQLINFDVRADINDDGSVNLHDLIVVAKNYGNSIQCTDNDSDSYSSDGGDCGIIDCNDYNPNINPGKSEICDNNLDDDCDNLVDEGCIVDNAYYVSMTGSDSNPGTKEQPWRTIDKANKNLQAGDLVYIREGTYHDILKPENSGTSGNKITYSSYNNENVIISGQSIGADLTYKSYIKINGIKFHSNDIMVLIDSGHYNLIQNSEFDGKENRGDSSYYGEGKGSFFIKSGSYNHVRNSNITSFGYYTADQDRGDLVMINKDSHHNLFENNEIYYGGHAAMSFRGKYNVIRNNYFHNEVWRDGYGNRNLESEESPSEYNLVEGNRVGFSGTPAARKYSCGIQLATPNNIFRYNSFYENAGCGVKLSTYNAMPYHADNNHIYNNVFYHNGIGPSDESWSDHRFGVKFNAIANPIKNVVIKNNVFYKNVLGPIGYHKTNAGDQVIENNWLTGDPQFVDVTSTLNPMNKELPNFNLRSTSPLIDAGTYLTKASNSDSGLLLKVQDALYFSDGFGIVDSDWIKIGNTEPVQIESVDYAVNEIILKQTRTWSVRDEIYLYKDSSGKVVYNGNKPDIGAYEYLD